MTTRIRYTKTSEPEIIESVKTFAHDTDGSRYKVKINTNTLTFTIIEDTSNTMRAEGMACNLHQVKMKAKAKLEEFGITFGTEGRNKKSS